MSNEIKPNKMEARTLELASKDRAELHQEAAEHEQQAARYRMLAAQKRAQADQDWTAVLNDLAEAHGVKIPEGSSTLLLSGPDGKIKALEWRPPEKKAEEKPVEKKIEVEILPLAKELAAAETSKTEEKPSEPATPST